MTPHIFHNIEFFAILPLVILLIVIARLVNVLFFKLIIMLSSLFFIGALPGITSSFVLFVGAIVVISWFLLFLWSKFVYFRQKSSFGIWVILSLLIVFKYPSVYDATIALIDNSELRSGLLPFFGISFLLLKLYSVFHDVKAKRVKSLNPIDFVCYFLFFPTFLSGPIFRYQKFVDSLELASTKPLGFGDLNIILPRFVLGCFKTFVLAGLLQPFALPFLSDTQLSVVSSVYLGLIFYYWYEYLNFSGYSDLSISTSKMMGIDVPENFNMPFLATSLTDVWRRWHISLAEWLRDYIYYPLLFGLMRTFVPSTKGLRAFLSATAIFITFSFCGLWHGEQLGMIVFGLLSGVVLGAEIMLTQLALPHLGNALHKTKARQYSFKFFSQVFTFHVAMFTFGPVLLTNEQFYLVCNTLVNALQKLAL